MVEGKKGFLGAVKVTGCETFMFALDVEKSY